MASPKPSTPEDKGTSPLSPGYEDSEPKTFVAFKVVMPEKEGSQSSSFFVSSALAYYTLSLGIGLLVLGSILTIILNDQPAQIYDPFSKNLTVTAILFLIIGSLLIASTILKCVYPWCQGNDDVTTEIKIQPMTSEQQPKIKPTSIPEENTILYNPFYPPVLVPYPESTCPQQERDWSGGENYKISFPNGNVNLLPGSMIFAEERKKPEEEQIKDLESKISEVMEAATNTASARGSCTSIRSRDQILKVEDLNFEKSPKF